MNLNSDLSENASSLSLNVGTNLSAFFTNDYLNNQRVAPWDMGAYEFGASGNRRFSPSLNLRRVQVYDPLSLVHY